MLCLKIFISLQRKLARSSVELDEEEEEEILAFMCSNRDLNSEQILA